MYTNQKGNPGLGRLVMWLRRLPQVPTDRRRSPRTQTNYLQLAYWNGSHGVRGRIREVSSHGAFVETADRWCAGTVLQAQLVAELPLPVLIPEAATQDPSALESDVIPSGGGNQVQTKSALATETVNIALTCRVVRLVPEGICVGFVHSNVKERHALEAFLLAVEERKRTVEISAIGASVAQTTGEMVVQAAPQDVVPAAPKDYVWWFPGCPVKVRLALEMVPRLSQRLWGAGSGNLEQGLLFGRSRGGVTEILDFQPAGDDSVPTMIAALPSESKQSLIGYYRTEQGETFHLNPQDQCLAEHCFREPYNVFLMVRSDRFGPPKATFYFHGEDGRMVDFAFMEFPFSPSLLATEERGRIQKSQPAAAERPIAIPLPPPARPPADDGSNKHGFVPRAIETSFNNRSFGERHSHILRKIFSGSASPSSSHHSMALRATRQNGDLELTWNPQSAPIAAATSGLISIEDGKSGRQVSLDSKQLRGGRLLYSPTSDQVWMSLTVTSPTGAAADAVTAILPKLGQTSPRKTGESPSNSVAAPPISIKPLEIVAQRVWALRTHVSMKWALIPVAILTLVFVWMLSRGSLGTSVSKTARVPIGLRVVSRGNQLEIHWNHDTATIRNAAKGVMRISDGGVQEVVEFDPTQLRDGAVAYSPKSNDVSVRFEVNALDGTSLSESVRSVAIP